ncbi:MAG: hypothetical protein Ct9H300mP17_05350 [Candidatus Nitrosopelagicus sp.]|nr:MAG: hypothetical protein Ct9H300mP17_05350 [Candidatus Nitrosopelagicus sp.]
MRKKNTNQWKTLEKRIGDDQSQYAVLAIIIVIGIGAAIFYLKGYKPKR